MRALLRLAPAARFVWKSASAASTVQWLWSIGGAALITGGASAVLRLPFPWSAVVAVGLFLILLAGVLAVIEAWQEARINGSAPAPAKSILQSPNLAIAKRLARLYREGERQRSAAKAVLGKNPTAPHAPYEAEAKRWSQRVRVELGAISAHEQDMWDLSRPMKRDDLHGVVRFYDELLRALAQTVKTIERQP